MRNFVSSTIIQSYLLVILLDYQLLNNMDLHLLMIMINLQHLQNLLKEINYANLLQKNQTNVAVLNFLFHANMIFQVLNQILNGLVIFNINIVHSVAHSVLEKKNFVQILLHKSIIWVYQFKCVKRWLERKKK